KTGPLCKFRTDVVRNTGLEVCQIQAIRTTLGPHGMDKLIVDGRGKATISNDGATILKLLDVVHPAAKTLVDIAKSQDAEVGDGTTSVTLLAAEFLKQVKPMWKKVCTHRSSSELSALPPSWQLTRSKRSL
uniref:TCP-1-eta n=1 Tax=Canis lupus familiaris TaxID=9615 RepID=A0A8C0SPX5_CANLF